MARLSRDTRRARVHELYHEHELSIRQIADRLGVGRSTVHTDLKAPRPVISPVPNLQTDDGRPVAGAEVGNTRALQHGVHSPRVLAPLREAHTKRLAARYPDLDDQRLYLLADLAAKREAGNNWLDRQGGVVRNDDGDVYAVVVQVERWSAREWSIVTELERESAERKPFDALREFAAEGSAQEVTS